jgi:hypothetical protein
MKDIEKVRQIFLADDVDDEVRAENEEKIREWEEGLLKNEALLSWRDHDITKLIAAQAKISFKDLAIQLANNRTLTEDQRKSLWAQQDAMKWLLTLTEMDPASELKRIHEEIRAALG